MDRLNEHTDEGRAYLKRLAKEIEKQLRLMQVSVESQALNLRDTFREERERLQQLAEDQADAATPVGKRRGSLYAPLNLFVRCRLGALEVYWQEVHVRGPGSARQFVYLRRNADGNYSVPRLLAKAQPFEVELVAEAERRAQELRALWRDCSQIRRALQSIERRTRPLAHTDRTPGAGGSGPGRFDLVPGRPAYE
jgi:hypothetical protein